MSGGWNTIDRDPDEMLNCARAIKRSGTWMGHTEWTKSKGVCLSYTVSIRENPPKRKPSKIWLTR